MLATRALRQLKRSTTADPTKYHTTPANAFWEKFRKAMVISPDINSGMMLNTAHGYPGSPDTLQVTPASKASDPADNPYHARDFRRMYPKLQAVTQDDLAGLLLAAPEQMQLPAPSVAAPADGTAVATVGTPSLSSLYTSAPTASGWKPPTPPGKPYKYTLTDNIPHNPDAYFPMVNYS